MSRLHAASVLPGFLVVGAEGQSYRKAEGHQNGYGDEECHQLPHFFLLSVERAHCCIRWNEPSGSHPLQLGASFDFMCRIRKEILEVEPMALFCSRLGRTGLVWHDAARELIETQFQ